MFINIKKIIYNYIHLLSFYQSLERMSDLLYLSSCFILLLELSDFW